MHTVLANTRRADVSFYPDGRIDISARVAKILSLSSGDVINISCEPSEVCIFIQNRQPEGRHEAQCFPTNRRGRHFRCYSKRITDWIFSRQTDKKQLPVCVPAGTPMKHPVYDVLVPLIYKFNLNKQQSND